MHCPARAWTGWPDARHADRDEAAAGKRAQKKHAAVEHARPQDMGMSHRLPSRGVHGGAGHVARHCRQERTGTGILGTASRRRDACGIKKDQSASKCARDRAFMRKRRAIGAA
jgi:hypothetical protein